MAVQKKKRLSLGLQGGGAHGAFTWGVLDRFLSEDRIELCSISGTSAGAMNAVIAADGLVRGGPKGACELLESFWHAVSEAARSSPFQRTPYDMIMGTWSLDHSPGLIATEMMSQFFGPTQTNPLKLNPLRDILVKHVDFDNVCSCDHMNVYVAATNVNSGKVKIFERSEMTADMVMASACLPSIFEAVEIDGIPYWDGGYSGNPPLFPLYRGNNCSDIAIVQINPVERPGAPTSAREIQNRVNEITFNSSLLKELRALDFVKRLLAEGSLDKTKYRDFNVHIVQCQEELMPLGASSKLNAEWAFLTHLRDIGQRAADAWLDENFDAIGTRSTVDLRAMFEGIGHNG